MTYQKSTLGFVVISCCEILSVERSEVSVWHVVDVASIHSSLVILFDSFVTYFYQSI